MWYVGGDWADQHHEVVVIDEHGQQIGAKRIAHTVAGLGERVAFLRAVGDGAEPPDHLAGILETNKGWLITALLEAGFPIYPVNPKTLQGWRKPSGAKTDQIDAWLLARKGRSDLDQMHRLEPDSPLIAELKQLTRDQDSLIHMQTRLVNQLHACLKADYPVATTVFTKLPQPLTRDFLRAYPTPDAGRAASEAQLAATRRMATHPPPEHKARHVWQVVQAPQLQADAVTPRAKARLMLALLAQLEPRMPAGDSSDRQIARLFPAHADAPVCTSWPGAGKRRAPRLLAEWGDDRTRYADAGSVPALAGTSPVAFHSGNCCAAPRRRACNKALRASLHHFACESVRCGESWADPYYQRKRREGKSHSVAVRALANQGVRLIYAIWLKRGIYDAALFHTAQQAHAHPAA
jgi:transposase